MRCHTNTTSGALGSPAYRDHPDLCHVAELLTGGLPDGVTIVFTDRATSNTSYALQLRTTHFEFFRLRLGRRSLGQALRLDWSDDPGPLLDRLFIFGPAAVDVLE